VSAVRGGDVERTVNWSSAMSGACSLWPGAGSAMPRWRRATQEAFIRGYRRLWLLATARSLPAGSPPSLATPLSISVSRHRAELNKRERWSLEQTAAPEISAGESDAPCTPEMLRQTLEELPAAHAKA